MESSAQVKLVTQEEANQIDINDVKYYTLTDGTIIRIKGEEDNKEEPEIRFDEQVSSQKNQNEDIKIQSQKQLLEENNEIQTSIEQTHQNKRQEQNPNISSNQYQYQYQPEEKNQRQNHQILNFDQKNNNLKKNTNLNSGIKNQRNQGEILEPGENYGYFISPKIRNNNTNTSKNNTNNNYKLLNQNTLYDDCHILNQGYINANAHLIDAEAIQGPILSQLEFKDLAQSGPQIYQQGPIVRRKLYKLVEAVPIEFKDAYGNQFMNQKNKNNILLNLQKYNYNTYLVEKSRKQKPYINQTMGKNYQARTYQNHYINNYNYNYPRVNQYLNGQKIVQQNQQCMHYNNDRYNNHQIKTVNQSRNIIEQEFEKEKFIGNQNRGYSNSNHNCNCIYNIQAFKGKGNVQNQSQYKKRFGNNEKSSCHIGHNE